MERINENALALSAGIVSVLAYIVCLIFVAVLPLEAIIAIGNYMSHGVDIAKIAAKNITLGSVFVGTIGWFVVSYIAAYVFAYLYNRLAK